ncbi:hypothetical protein BDD12DRAFT_891839 [Trichophaea hybrida]|nr:hypothetical protein BDD12DRAFT_891839 [Trichophaea hybrida]
MTPQGPSLVKYSTSGMLKSIHPKGWTGRNLDFRTDSRSKFYTGLLHDVECVWDWEEDFAYERNSLFREILLEPLARLLEALPRPDVNILPRTLLGIDEAGNLLNERLDGSLRTFLNTAIRRALYSLKAYRIWAVFLSTNGRMETFSTSQANVPSSRLESGQLNRITPYVSLELHVEERHRRMANPSAKFEPMSQYATIKHTTGFRRPLWRLYSTKSYTELSELILTKLLGGGNV